MSLHARTPVQIARVTRDLDATEAALTGLLDVKKWVRIPRAHFTPDACTYRGEPADFVADISLSYAGDMPPGIRFAYVAAAGAGVPFVEIAQFPVEIKAFFDYIKQEQR